MKVKMKTTFAGPNGTARPGTIIDVTEKQAIDLVSGKYAEYVKESTVDPVKPAKTVTDKAPHNCNRKQLDAIVAAEKVDIGDAKTNVTIADAIVVHRENILAAETVNEITTYLQTRTECDEKCRYADGEECTMPEDYECPTQKESE